jgi:hypothetical protein
MREIIELNRQILAELPDKIREDALPEIDRADGPQLWPEASLAVKQAAEAVHAELNRCIPEDFSYTVLLGDEKPIVSLGFEDGAQMGSFQSLEIKEHLSIQGQLGSMDWDEQRGAEMSRCQVWDGMKEYAAQAPSSLPSTKKLQQSFRDEMREWVKEKRRDSSKVHVFLWNQEDGFKSESYKSLEALRAALPDIMVVELFVITIVADGKPLPVKRIDQIKAEELKTMKEHMPISYARATGRFGFGGVPVGSEEESDDEP